MESRKRNGKQKGQWKAERVMESSKGNGKQARQWKADTTMESSKGNEKQQKQWKAVRAMKSSKGNQMKQGQGKQQILENVGCKITYKKQGKVDEWWRLQTTPSLPVPDYALFQRRWLRRWRRGR